MRAATFTKTGPARDVLHVVDWPQPEPGPGEVRVRIATSGVNPSDVKRRGAAPAGKAAEFPTVIPHSDGAGTIDAVGAGVPDVRIGEHVWTLNAQFERAFGTAAESCVVPSAFAVPLPDNVDFAVGACIGIPVLTAYHAIMLDGSVRGQTLLVQGGTGAVGAYAIQFAKRDGATVIATVGSADKAARASALGADHVIDYRTENVAARVAEITSGKRVDRIIEVDLKANAPSYPDLLPRHAKAVIYGSGAGAIELPNLIPLSTTLQFVHVYTLANERRARYLAELDPILRSGELTHFVGGRFPLEKIVEAHEAVEAGALGNVVVDLPG